MKINLEELTERQLYGLEYVASRVKEEPQSYIETHVANLLENYAQQADKENNTLAMKGLEAQPTLKAQAILAGKAVEIAETPVEVKTPVK